MCADWENETRIGLDGADGSCDVVKMSSGAESTDQRDLSSLPGMSGTKIIKSALSDCKMTQLTLSRVMGYKAQGAVSERINTQRMSLDKFAEMLSAMGYEVVVQRVRTDAEGKVVERTDMWRVDAPEFTGEV